MSKTQETKLQPLDAAEVITNSRRTFLVGGLAVAGLAACGVNGKDGKDGQDGTDGAAGATGATGAIGATGATGAAGASAPLITWDKTVDVIVVGGGGAGLSAAYQAATDGANVLILEKAAATGGTTARCGGVIQAAGTSYQKQYAKVTDDTVALHAQTWILQGEGLVDADLITDHAKNMPAHIDWLVSLGLKIEGVYGHCHVPYVDDAGCDRRRIHQVTGAGKAIADALLAAVQKTSAKIQTSTEVTKLITDPEKGIIGVQAKDGAGATSFIKALRGVILATSSFDFSKDLAKALSPQHYWNLTNNVLNLCAPTNTGDGIRMGMAVGAALETCGGTIDLDVTTSQGVGDNANNLPCVWVNALGQRFVCEDTTYAYLERAVYQQQTMHQKPTYAIMDSVGVLQGAPWPTQAAVDGAVTSGTLVTAATVEALGTALGVPSDNLAATVARWNAMIVGGKDVDFRRNTGLVPISKGPFYAVKNVPLTLGPIGGLKINVQTEVLGSDGAVLPHLFAAGLVTGGWIGPYYPGSGTAVGGAIHFGLKAGKNAAASPNWEA